MINTSKIQNNACSVEIRRGEGVKEEERGESDLPEAHHIVVAELALEVEQAPPKAEKHVLAMNLLCARRYESRSRAAW